MTSLLGLGMLVMCAADAVVGVRLIALSLRTRELPEFALGNAVLLLGAVGYPLSVAARRGLGGDSGPEALLGWALAIQNLASLAMAVATWRTFRPASRWGTAACAGLGAALLASWCGQAFASGFSLAPGGSAAYWLGYAARALPFFWNACESWHYHGMLSRRLAIGLADPIVTDRFRLWAISASGVCAAFAVFGLAALRGVDVATSPEVLATSSLAGLVSGATLWLAFLPPRRYLRRFEEAPAR